MDDYEVIKVIGKGAFGTALLVRRNADLMPLVVKKIDVSQMSNKECDEAMNEV